jgi:hypothetical protein
LAKIRGWPKRCFKPSSQLLSAFFFHYPRRRLFLYLAKPRFTPEDYARFLTAVVIAAGTTQFLKENDIVLGESSHTGAQA